MSEASAPRVAVLRWAWRLFRREWRQQVLVLTMITIAVTAAVAGASLMTNAADIDRGGQFGAARGLTNIDNNDPAFAQRQIAAARARFGTIEIVGHSTMRVPGQAERVDVRSQDPKGVLGSSTLALRNGRYPTAAGEVALTKRLAARFGTKVGKSLAIDRTTLRVVGIVENPRELTDQFALIEPNAPSPGAFTLLLAHVNTPGHSTTAEATQRAGDNGPPDAAGSFAVMARGNNKGAVAASVLIVTTVAMLLVALIAGAGFVVVAQRRQRQLGMLAAIGATERHLRFVMAINGILVGATAAIVGTGLGVGGWIVAAPAAETLANHRLDRLTLPWSLIAEIAAITLVMATGAAWWPTRAVTKLPVMAALSGRPAEPTPVHRSILAAVVLLVGGALAIVGSNPTAREGQHVKPLFLIGGLVAMIVGTVFAAPSAIRLLTIPAKRLPFAPKLALRDLVRFHARAAAALAAITLVLAVTVALVGIANANIFGDDEGNLSSHDLLLQPTVLRVNEGPAAPPDASTLDSAAARVAAAVPGAKLIPLDIAYNPQSPRPETITMAHQVNAHEFQGRGIAYVASPALLAYVGSSAADIAASTELLTPKTDAGLLDTSVRQDPSVGAAVQRIAAPKFALAPTSLITAHGMAVHGWQSRRAAWLLTANHALSDADIAAATKAAAVAAIDVQARDAQNDVAAISTDATIVGLLVALAIAAVTVGLIRSEAVGDLRTLTATGAAAGTRRVITGSTTSALVGLGALLGVGGAYATLVAGYHADLGRLWPLPVAQLLMLVLGLPIVGGATGWLVAGREPATFSRQMTD